MQNSDEVYGIRADVKSYNLGQLVETTFSCITNSHTLRDKSVPNKIILRFLTLTPPTQC